MNSKILTGKLTISRQMNSRGGDFKPISITLVDELSGNEVVEIKVGLADFAEALTGLGRTGCDFELHDVSRVGRKHEIKHEVVFIPGKSYDAGDKRDARIAKALSPFEVDGWYGSTYDAKNHHNWTKHDAPGPDGKTEGTWVKVAFHRWVDVERAAGEATG